MAVKKEELKIGDSVYYQPSHYKKSEWENGIIKEIPTHANNSVRVVYNCGNNWGNYKDYTSALTSCNDLHKGWKTAVESYPSIKSQVLVEFDDLKVNESICRIKLKEKYYANVSYESRAFDSVIYRVKKQLNNKIFETNKDNIIIRIK